MIRCIESDGFTGGNEDVNTDRHDLAEAGVEVWAILHKGTAEVIETNHGSSLCDSFDLVHDFESDWTDELKWLEVRDSVLRYPNVWFLILHRCVERGVRSRLVRDFRKACEDLLAAKVSPDLQDLLAEHSREEVFYLVRMTEAQHRRAAMMAGLASDLLLGVLGNRLEEINALQKRLCEREERAEN